MTKFFIKIIIFLIPFIVVYNIPKLAHYTFHTDIKQKINSLVDNSSEPMIIACGDSRAERQIIPQLIEDRLGIKSVNIGVTGGDIAVLYNALEQHELINPQHTLIISISSIETNDGVVDKWGIPHAYITYFSTLDNIKLFGIRYLNMMHERLRLILKELFQIEKNTKLVHSDTRFSNKGFWGIAGDVSNFNFDEVDIHSNTLKTSWYLDSNHEGVKKEVFGKLISKIADLDMNIIIFQPPVSPGWLKRTKNTFIDSIELDHSKLLKNISNKYDNISFIDFYTNQSTTFHDSMFYNSIHYNYKGAEIFTTALIDTITLRNLLR